MTPVQAVFFDLDGTLIDDELAARRCAEVTLEELGMRLRGLDAKAMAASFLQHGNSYWRHRVATGLDDSRGSRLLLWQQTLEEHGAQAPGLAADLAMLYAALRERTAAAFADAQPVVEALVGHGYRLAVITNGQAKVQRNKLKLAGLDDYFDAVIASSDVGAGKPERVVFEAALEALAADPSTTWHVGDNLAADVAGALNAGLRAAWLNRGGEQREDHHLKPDAELRSLWELPSILSPPNEGSS